MRSTASLRRVLSFAAGAARATEQWFPAPRTLLPRAAGIDISDSSIKWVECSPDGSHKKVVSFGEEALSPGIVARGAIQDVEGLSAVLTEIKAHLGGVQYAHSALPEEAAYVFSMHVPEGASRSQIMSMVEFELDGRVPIPPSAAVFDFNVIAEQAVGGTEIGVVAFPRDFAERYAAAFEGAGLTLLSLEVEASSIARAVSNGTPDEPITLLVDFGRARTGFAVLHHGVPIFTSTVEVGGDTITSALEQGLGMSEEEVENFKNNTGLLLEGEEKKRAGGAIERVAGALADEIAKHYRYWDTRRNERGERMTPVGRVLLVGGSSNLKGLTDYVATTVHAPTELGDVWKHIASHDAYIPPIPRSSSLQYATAIGLAMRGL
jgi:type IV pilus assembly protein PilM